MYKTVVWTAVAVLGLASMVTAQQIVNGEFSDGFNGWITNEGWMAIQDIDTSGDNELVFFGTNLVHQWAEANLAFQDFNATNYDFTKGMAFSVDMGATNLAHDIRVFSKIEFWGATGQIGHLTQSGEWADGKYARSNEFIHKCVIVRHARELTNQIADVTSIRPVLYLLRFDNLGTIGTGAGYLDNASLGFVASSAEFSGVINGNFEYDEWGWHEGYTSSRESWHTDDLDGDGDNELKLDDAGLVGQYANQLFTEDLSVEGIDWTDGISLVADIGASNLTEGFRAFTKLEFFRGGSPYNGGTVMGSATMSGEYDVNLFAATNIQRYGVALTKDYATLTNQLANEGSGYTVDDISFVRIVLFLMAFAPNPAPGGGFAWFDNVHIDYGSIVYPTALNIGRVGLNGFSMRWVSEASQTYAIQHTPDLYDPAWSNIVNGITGLPAMTGYTNSMMGTNGFFRVTEE